MHCLPPNRKYANQFTSSHRRSWKVCKYYLGKNFYQYHHCICDITELGFSPNLKQCEAQALLSVVSQQNHTLPSTHSKPLLENPTLCGIEIGQNGTLVILAYAHCRQWECPPLGTQSQVIHGGCPTKVILQALGLESPTESSCSIGREQWWWWMMMMPMLSANPAAAVSRNVQYLGPEDKFCWTSLVSLCMISRVGLATSLFSPVSGDLFCLLRFSVYANASPFWTFVIVLQTCYVLLQEQLLVCVLLRCLPPCLNFKQQKEKTKKKKSPESNHVRCVWHTCANLTWNNTLLFILYVVTRRVGSPVKSFSTCVHGLDCPKA